MTRILLMSTLVMWLPAFTAADELKGTVVSVDASRSVATVQLTGSLLPAVGDPVSITWTLDAEVFPIADGVVVSIIDNQVEVSFQETGSQVSPRMDVVIVSVDPTAGSGSDGSRVGENGGKDTRISGNETDVVPSLAEQYLVDVTRTEISGGDNSSLQADGLYIDTEGWRARFIAERQLGGDFQFAASVKLLDTYNDAAIAGLIFDSSIGADEDLAIGAIFLGKTTDEIVVSRKITHDRWDDLFSARLPADGTDNDFFFMTRTDSTFAFWSNSTLIGEWQGPAVSVGMPKFYVNGGHARIQGWNVVAAPGSFTER